MADLDPTTLVANMLARHRYGPGLDAGGAHNPTFAEERLAERILRELTPLIAGQVRQATADTIAQRFRDLGITPILAADAASIALTGEPRPRICLCGHPQDQHRDQWAGYTERDMTRSPNRGSCTTNCGCRLYRWDPAAIARRAGDGDGTATT